MKENKWKNLGLTVLVAVACLVVYFNLHLTDLLGIKASDNAKDLINEIAMFLLFYLGAVILSRKDVIKFKKEGFGVGFLIYLLPMLNVISTIKKMAGDYATYGTFMQISIGELLSTIVLTLFIGLAEETLFRGIIQNSLHDFFGEKNVGSVRAAIIIQAFVFGGVHLINYFTGSSDLGSAIIQILSATGMGFLFGAMYYCSGKNLWVPVIFHAFGDFRGLVHSGSLLGKNLSDNLSSYSSAYTVPAGYESMPYVLIGLLSIAYLVVMLIATRKKAIDKYLK